ncbi:hypothetical protein [Winogradskyella sp.]|uniref:hypothetical protein n=1 Tax=Winogradskyella sp. TaxID=1883156 RepID=UPI003BACBB22
MVSIKNRTWSLFEKIGFRLVFIYFILIILFQNNGAFPFWDWLFAYPTKWIEQFIPWLGSNIYGIEEEVTVKVTGSGDTMFDNLIALTSLIVALIGTMIWSFIDRKRNDYDTLYYWLTTGIRYYVGLMLISYGMVKVIQLQFSYPGFYRLIEPYGESSPMGLAWTFLGFSKGYNIFMGVAELLAGLLLFRRTMTFGALITLMTAMNVMAVNYFYDVPVKLLSTHLVLMTLFLLSKDIKRVALFFFTKVSTTIEVIKRPKFKRGLRIAINSFKALLIAYVFVYGFIETLESQKKYGSKAPKPELYGMYKITDFVINGDTITNYKNKKLWKSISVQWEGSMQVRNFEGDTPVYFGVEKDSLVDRRLKLTRWGKEPVSFDFNYKKLDSTGLEFNFVFQGDTIQGLSKRLGIKDFRLTSRGFHWISEYPYNR